MRLITVEELAKYLNLNPHTIYMWVEQKKIPFIKIGRMVRFDLIEIEEWLISKKTEIEEAPAHQVSLSKN
ncbi:MAG: helix-turn-helix domain-containing protein [Candidatus Omnitrophica bacterium]|nr:helix-turn-helix domain-containing protein [Candidatus Omnitrophota bacterium]MDD5237037.1 helix-turn-helix domain-containing protein [Candidatus Omnitrophota bacterium]MDD5611231.1 helix-turn-helix domain-containing protein [Candidatus Omnitrophota bacterium]